MRRFLRDANIAFHVDRIELVTLRRHHHGDRKARMLAAVLDAVKQQPELDELRLSVFDAYDLFKLQPGRPARGWRRS